MATSLTLQNDPTLQQGYIQVNGTTSATFTTSGITANLTGNADTATKLSTTTGSAPAYACRAWVNFDGTRDTTGALSTANTNRLIRSSGNVTSVLRTGAGFYTINFTIPMSDANYSASANAGNYTVGAEILQPGVYAFNVNSLSINVRNTTATAYVDVSSISTQVFGN